MPVLKLYPNGLTGGVPPRVLNHAPVLRGDCKGWTLRSSRGNTRFLYSVLTPELPVSAIGAPLLGLSGSLTLRDCPPSHDDWKTLREAFFVRLRRKGLYRLHWLTEWQKRGVPHLHFAAWFLQSVVVININQPALSDFELAQVLSSLISADWLSISSVYRSSGLSQEVKPISDELGWLQYLSKHAARGAVHYQRAEGSIPSGWEGMTGRMWGHLGNFPVREPFGLELDDCGWFRFRRIVRGWRCAQARSERKVSPGRIKSSRRMLCCSDFSLSRVRGVSEWISLTLGLQIVHWISSCGHSVESTIS